MRRRETSACRASTVRNHLFSARRKLRAELRKRYPEYVPARRKTVDEPRIEKGRVPPEAVVIPGTMPKRFPAGEFGVPCALIIGRRKPSTDLKTSLNETLREFAVSV